MQRNTKKINAVTGKKIAVSSERNLKAISEAFIEYLKVIAEELTEIEKSEQEAKE